MKVKEYREMMKYLTRPGTPNQGQKDMETQVRNLLRIIKILELLKS